LSICLPREVAVAGRAMVVMVASLPAST
jgi:hypothetical protein